MKKLFFTFFAVTALLFTAGKTYAQKATLTLAPEFYVPFDNPWSVGIGGILEAEWKVEPKLGLTAGGGVGVLFAKNDFIEDYAFIPLKGGIKYHATEKVNLHANLGAAIGLGDYGTNAIFGAGFGYKFNNRVEGGIRVEDAGPTYLGLKVAFTL
jgi:hypothetical protein